MEILTSPNVYKKLTMGMGDGFWKGFAIGL
jgi:hypothetical protein